MAEIQKDVADLITGIREGSLASVANRYYSIYRAIVTNNQDPSNLGRIQVQCGTTQGASDVWVKPSFDGAAAGRGTFFVPEVGDVVFISFYEGDPLNPECYFGGWYGQIGATPPTTASVSSSQTTSNPSASEVPIFLQPPSSGYPEKKGIVTRAGHALVFNDEAGKESVTLVWNQPIPTDPALEDRTKTAAYNKGIPAPTPAFVGQKLGSSILTMDRTGVMLKTASSFMIQIDESKGAMTLAAPSGSMFYISPNGSIQMIHKSGASIAMSATAINISAAVSQGQNVNISGQSVTLNAGAMNLGGKASDFAVMGIKLIAWLAKHTHPYSFGTTLPPTTPPTPADFCSNTIKVQP
jgi:hypothetical protein